MADSRGVRIFLSYSHLDATDCVDLTNQLRPLVQKGLIDLWWDKRLSAGEWSPEILNRLDAADLILLLVTANYVGSKNCEAEYLRAMERHDGNDAVVVPIWMRSVDFPKTAFGKLNPFPKGYRPVDLRPNRDVALAQVCADITEVVDRIRQGPGFDDPWDRTDCGRLAAFKKAAAIDEQAGLLPHLCDRSPLEIAVRRGLG